MHNFSCLFCVIVTYFINILKFNTYKKLYNLALRHFLYRIFRVITHVNTWNTKILFYVCFNLFKETAVKYVLYHIAKYIVFVFYTFI